MPGFHSTQPNGFNQMNPRQKGPHTNRASEKGNKKNQQVGNQALRPKLRHEAKKKKPGIQLTLVISRKSQERKPGRKLTGNHNDDKPTKDKNRKQCPAPG